MALTIFTRALQLLSAVALISLLALIDSTEAYAIDSSSRPSTIDIGKESNSVRFLSDPNWRAQQLGNRVHGEDKDTIDVSHEQKFAANLESDEGKEDSNPMSLNSESSSMSRTNPFLRSKRDTASSSSSCSLPANLPEKVEKLNSFLTDSQYVGVIPQQDDFIPLPSNQPHDCPAPTGSWWTTRTEPNLRSTCPYIKEELDNGPDAYPRHLIQAKCLCTECVGQNINSCQEIRHDVTIFRLKGCQDGLALMEKDIVTVTLGCFCAAPRVTADNPLPPFLQ
ncbi:hypothetical protein RRG08_027252 [Elysia crispata]|uniref:CTCK domain-containing protein n=1 Tax=Elysia crispata TaxID=231223 RepID=A0AAE1DN30_9GAST|nr:hypothetical protein RRG08_027252 [Elysia crispata]